MTLAAQLEEASRKLSPKAITTLQALVDHGPLAWVAKAGKYSFNFFFVKERGIEKRVKGLHTIALDGLVDRGYVQQDRFRLTAPEATAKHFPKGAGHVKNLFPYREPVYEITPKGRAALDSVKGSLPAEKKKFHVVARRKGSSSEVYVTKVKRGWGSRGILTGLKGDARAFSENQAKDVAGQLSDDPRWESAEVRPA